MIGKSIDDAWCAFRDTLLSCIHKYVPSRKAKKKPKKPWITVETINLAKRKRRLYRASRKDPDNPSKWNKYKQLRNKLDTQFRKDYYEYLKDVSNDNSNCGAKFWSFVRASKAKQCSISFKEGDTVVTDLPTIATSFNKFFASNCTDKDFVDTSFTICNGHVGSPLESIGTNANKIFELINYLKSGKAPWPDSITSTMLKITAGQVAMLFPCFSIHLLAKEEYLMT